MSIKGTVMYFLDVVALVLLIVLTLTIVFGSFVLNTEEHFGVTTEEFTVTSLTDKGDEVCIKHEGTEYCFNKWMENPQIGDTCKWKRVSRDIKEVSCE